MRIVEVWEVSYIESLVAGVLLKQRTVASRRPIGGGNKVLVFWTNASSSDSAAVADV